MNWTIITINKPTMICESNYYFIYCLLFYNLVIIALLNSDLNTKTVS